VLKIDFGNATLTYAAAGVEAGIVFANRTRHEHLVATGPLLGIAERPIYLERSLSFGPGHVLVAYTDGVTEAQSVHSSKALGSFGIVRSMNEVRRSGLTDVRALWRCIDRYTGGIYNDDATLALLTTRALAVRGHA
jgi:hypothetical protein